MKAAGGAGIMMAGGRWRWWPVWPAIAGNFGGRPWSAPFRDLNKEIWEVLSLILLIMRRMQEEASHGKRSQGGPKQVAS